MDVRVVDHPMLAPLEEGDYRLRLRLQRTTFHARMSRSWLRLLRRWNGIARYRITVVSPFSALLELAIVKMLPWPHSTEVHCVQGKVVKKGGVLGCCEDLTRS